MATLKDVAERAKVSLSTVSRVLNSDKAFPEATRRCVWDAASELDYRPDQAARSLRLKSSAGGRRKTGLIAHVFCAGHRIDESSFDHFRSHISHLLAIETANRGLFAISACYAGDDWGFVCKPALDGLVDGVIAGTPHAGLVDILRKYVPVVLMDVPFSPGTFGLPVVNVNQRNGVWMLARRLHELGHRSVALLDIANDLFAPARTSHFREAAGHYGIKIHPASGAPREISPATHEAVMRSFAELVAPLAKHGEISAVVCPGNTYATTLLENLGPLGVSVPGECSVTGFDSHVVGCHGVVSRVTGVGYPWRRLICAALDTLRRGIDHPGAPPVETLVEPELVEGETCAAAKFIGKKNTKTRGVSK